MSGGAWDEVGGAAGGTVDGDAARVVEASVRPGRPSRWPAAPLPATLVTTPSA